jgi:hypothetical protein
VERSREIDSNAPPPAPHHTKVHDAALWVVHPYGTASTQHPGAGGADTLMEERVGAGAGAAASPGVEVAEAAAAAAGAGRVTRVAWGDGISYLWDPQSLAAVHEPGAGGAQGSGVMGAAADAAAAEDLEEGPLGVAGMEMVCQGGLRG